MVRFAWPGWWLGLFLGSGFPGVAQKQDPKPSVELKENYPNPFYPSTTIPFEIRPEICSAGYKPLVRLEVRNSIAQLVAIPTVSAYGAQRLDLVRLACGEYRAFWDGKYLDGQQEVTTGVYYYRLTVDGRPYTRKMIVQRRPAPAATSSK
ncbi:MAG: hypothetical protein H0U85_07595 [Gemmatimonadales bacterium]|nr:hypothetical protein [Gemmatimonadales bacterium]